MPGESQDFVTLRNLLQSRGIISRDVNPLTPMELAVAIRATPKPKAAPTIAEPEETDDDQDQYDRDDAPEEDVSTLSHAAVHESGHVLAYFWRWTFPASSRR